MLRPLNGVGRWTTSLITTAAVMDTRRDGGDIGIMSLGQ
jgi:hypothetical protein